MVNGQTGRRRPKQSGEIELPSSIFISVGGCRPCLHQTPIEARSVPASEAECGRRSRSRPRNVSVPSYRPFKSRAEASVTLLQLVPGSGEGQNTASWPSYFYEERSLDWQMKSEPLWFCSWESRKRGSLGFGPPGCFSFMHLLASDPHSVEFHAAARSSAPFLTHGDEAGGDACC